MAAGEAARGAVVVADLAESRSKARAGHVYHGDSPGREQVRVPSGLDARNDAVPVPALQRTHGLEHPAVAVQVPVRPSTGEAHDPSRDPALVVVDKPHEQPHASARMSPHPGSPPVASQFAKRDKVYAFQAFWKAGTTV